MTPRMRSRRRIGVRFLMTTMVAASMLTGVAAGASPPATSRSAPEALSPDSGPEVQHDTSLPLRNVVPAVATKSAPVRPLLATSPSGPAPATAGNVQTAVGPGSIPTPTTSRDGVGDGFVGPQGTYGIVYAPPDTNGAVGLTQYVSLVNAAFAVMNKATGAVEYGPVNTSTLWTNFTGHCETDNQGDGLVLYDRIANRWVISQFAGIGSPGPFFQCVAVSTSADAAGSYNRYAFQYANFPDYGKLGAWPDAYYITFNNFNAAGTVYLGPEECAYDRSRMIAGLSASQVCFNQGTTLNTVMPSDFGGDIAPPAGAPNVYVARGDTPTTIDSFKFHVDFAIPALSSFTGPTALTVDPYTAACFSECVPQLGTRQQLDGLGDRLMYRLDYRNFGDHESLVINHSVVTNGVIGIRWYELRLVGGNPTVFQQGTYAPDSTYRWMGSVAMDRAGDIGLSFSASSAALHPSVRYTGRLATDPAGQMGQGEGTLITGGGSQTTGFLSRWGDYSQINVDPSDNCTFWFTNEYIPVDGSFNWKTRIGSFKFPSCTAGDNFSIAVTPAAGSVNQGGSFPATVDTATTQGSAQTINLSASGLPAGTTATFNPPGVTAGSSSTLTLAVGTSTPPGSYAVSVTGTGTATHSTNFTLIVAGPANLLVNPGFEADANADNAPDNWTTNTRFGRSLTTTPPPHEGTYVGKFAGTTNSAVTITQTVNALNAGQSYAFSGWASIPAQTDGTFTFKFQVRWLNASNRTISTKTLKTYKAPTTGWSQTAGSLVAPAGTTHAQVRMVAGSLNGAFLVDDLLLH